MRYSQSGRTPWLTTRLEKQTRNGCADRRDPRIYAQPLQGVARCRLRGVRPDVRATSS